jgi:hypothetical protein
MILHRPTEVPKICVYSKLDGSMFLTITQKVYAPMSSTLWLGSELRVHSRPQNR